MKTLLEQWRILLPLVLGLFAVWKLLPQKQGRQPVLGGIVGFVALALLQQHLLPPAGDLTRDLLFYVFSGTAILSAIAMITNENPIYSALWFALVTIAVCGMFLLNAAPFLAAATVIVYAGAIIVTFVFVIMLAQQEGNRTYDAESNQPLLASLSAFIILGAMLFTLQEFSGRGPNSAGPGRLLNTGIAAKTLAGVHPLSRPIKGDLGSLQGVGRSLFGDYLLGVELAGTILLVATIGAIALAPRRSQGTL